MGQDEKIRGAQEILNWAIMYSKVNINCKVIDYKYENYKVQFFTKENKLIMPVQVPEEWIRGSNPKENLIHDRLKILLENLRNY
jgi:hypothetical protein